MNRLGDYKLRRRLAVGGMGEVYLGEKIGPEGFVKPVVLKCVLPQLSRDPAFVQLFLDEARVAALLNHPNIAQVYDFGEADGIYYMAMEYVPGYTIDDIRRKHAKIERKMPIEHIACIASQACQGLEYAHSLSDSRGVSLGLVHRDVSPHNVMVSVDGGVKIVDFGIAKARAGLTRVEATGAVGKFGYMSPEQARGEGVDGRTDVFSLGVCIWELLTTQRLHDAKLDRPPNYDAARPILSAASFRKDMPKQFERLLHSALAIDKMDRFTGCHQMHLELERLMAAMIHYAGHAALAGYIKALVDGKYDSDELPRSSGGLVEPVNAPAARGEAQKHTEELEAAQKYEEVFGTQSADKEVKTGKRLPKVPAAFRSKSPQIAPEKEKQSSPLKNAKPPAAERRRKHPMDLGPDLELDVPADPTPMTRSSHASAMPRPYVAPRRSSKANGLNGMTLVLILIVFGGLGAATWHYREQILNRYEELMGTSAKVDMSTRFRVISVPAGGEVFVDGERKGSTPVIVEFLPEFTHYIEVRKKGFATDRRRFSAEISKGLREIQINFGPSATLGIKSKPAGGTVSLNGVEIPGVRTPATLKNVPAGETLNVTVKKAGIKPVTLKVKIPKKGSETLFFNLQGK